MKALETKTVPSDTPEGWLELPLSQCVNVLDARRVPINSEERKGRVGSVPYYGATGQVGWIDDYIFDEELVLLGEDGAPFLDKCKPIAYLIFGKSWVNNHAHVLRAIAGLTLNRFIKYFLDSFDFAECVNGTTRLKLTQASMNSIPVRLPPLREQERIIERIDRCLDHLSNANERLQLSNAVLKKFRQSVLAAACSGRLTADWREENVEIQFASDPLKSILKERKERTCFGRYEEPKRPQAQDLPELPDAWCYASVDQLLSEPLANGRSVVTREGGFPVLRMTALKDGRLDLSERKTGAWTAKDARPFLVQKSDFLVARGNGSLALVGRGALLEDDPDPVAYPDTLIRLRLCILPRYLRLVWNSDFMRKQVEAAAHTTAGIHKVSQKDIASFVMPLCPQEEQTEIVRRVEALFKLADAIEKRVGAAQLRADKLTQSILAKAFRGELVPTEAELARREGRDYEPASVLLERIRNQRSPLRSKKAEYRIVEKGSV